MQQASSQPEWGTVELPAFLQEAQTQVWASMAARFAPGAKLAATSSASTPAAFHASVASSRKAAAPLSPVLPSASAAALWGWSNGDSGER